MINVKVLKQYIEDSGYSYQDVARNLGISVKTLKKQLKEGVFGTGQIFILVTLLNIKNPGTVFFTDALNIIRKDDILD